MKLYVNHFGQWAGNQDDARSYGHPFDQVEVPYDKKGLLEFLNENKVTVSCGPDNVPPPLAPTSIEEAPESGKWSASATRYDIHDAAVNAPLKDLGVALAVYMTRVDEELYK